MVRPKLAYDEVDHIVAAWRRERPDIDVEPLGVLSRLTRLSRHFDLARRAAFGGHGLEPWEFDVLAALRRQGAPYQLSPGALLHETLVTSGTMTHRIDRLVERGLVTRRPVPGDRRSVLVELTDAGCQRIDAAMSELIAREHEMLAVLTVEQRQILADLLRELSLPFDAEA